VAYRHELELVHADGVRYAHSDVQGMSTPMAGFIATSLSTSMPTARGTALRHVHGRQHSLGDAHRHKHGHVHAEGSHSGHAPAHKHDDHEHAAEVLALEARVLAKNDALAAKNLG
jgi:hypothetical protein